MTTVAWAAISRWLVHGRNKVLDIGIPDLELLFALELGRVASVFMAVAAGAAFVTGLVALVMYVGRSAWMWVFTVGRSAVAVWVDTLTWGIAPPRLPVWNNPVLWRELNTSSRVGADWAPWLALVLACGAVVGAVATFGLPAYGSGIAIAVAFGLIGLVYGASMATRAVAEERSAGRLVILLMGTTTPLQMVVAKAVQPFGVISAWLTAAHLLGAAGFMVDFNTANRAAAPEWRTWVAVWAGLDIGMFQAWLLALALAASVTFVAVAARSTSRWRAMSTSLALAVVAPLVPAAVYWMVGTLPTVVAAWLELPPLPFNGVRATGNQLWSVCVSACIMVTLALGVCAWSSLRLRSWSLRPWDLDTR